MNNIKYFKPLTIEQIVERTEQAYKKLTYQDMLQAITNIEEAHEYREPLIKEARKLVDKQKLTAFESMFMLILFRDLEAEIKLGGDDCE